MRESTPRKWWPHVELRHEATWRGQAWLFRVQPQATLEFADRIEIYDLDSDEHRLLSTLSYNDRIANLLHRRPDRVIEKIDQVAEATFASIFTG